MAGHEPTDAAIENANKKKEAAAAATPAPAAPVAAPVAATQPDLFDQSAAGAAGYGSAYDAATAADTAGGAAATMQRAQDAARSTAQTQSDLAVQQAAKAAKTSGMMGGQAALAATGQAANSYGQGLESGINQYGQNVTREAQLGEGMSGRLATAGQGKVGQQNANTAQISAAAQAAQAKTDSQNALFGNILGTVGGIAGLFSDRRLKDNVKKGPSYSDSMAKLKTYTFSYKGSDRPEGGIMAQDLEKTAMAPAVVDTPQGKMLDTRRLTAMNTAAIGEQSARTKRIEKMLAEMKGVDRG